MNARCVIGIGCDDHGDQIAGLLVARRIVALGPDGVAVHESTGAPEQLVAAWSGAGEAVVVEAMPGAGPGTVSRCQPPGRAPCRAASRTRAPLPASDLPRSPLATKV